MKPDEGDQLSFCYPIGSRLQQVREIQVLQKAVHASGMPAQERCGLFVVSSGTGKSTPDDFSFRPNHTRLIRLWSAFQHFLRKIFLANDVFRTKHDGLLDDVLKLAHVARPIVIAEDRLRLRRKAAHIACGFARMLQPPGDRDSWRR